MCPQPLYIFTNSAQDQEQLATEVMRPYLAVGLEFLSRHQNLDQQYDISHRQGVALRTLDEMSEVPCFLTWDKWEGKIPSLPGETNREEYGEAVVWPGPPPPPCALDSIPRLKDRHPYHSAFYVARTGRFVTH